MQWLQSTMVGDDGTWSTRFNFLGTITIVYNKKALQSILLLSYTQRGQSDMTEDDETSTDIHASPTIKTVMY